MASNSSIEWTDCTWNPLAGCKEVSPGCRNCYAATMAHRIGAMARADLAAGKNSGKKRHYIGTTERRGGKVVWNGKINLINEALHDPFRWKKPRKVFVNSMSDLFHEDVPDSFIDSVFAVMALADWHTFQVLTKRPERMANYINGRAYGRWCNIAQVMRCDRSTRNNSYPLRNVWLGTSCEDQARADQRVFCLQKCPAAVRFISAEPLLGPINDMSLDGIDWVIAGCESGHGRRKTEQVWVESLADQCRSAGVSLFNKQLEIDRKVEADISKFPEHLQVREFPGVAG